MTETSPAPSTDPQASDAMVGPHGPADDHGADHGHDDHAHVVEGLGPVDLTAWGAGVLGVVLGIAIVIAIAIAAGALG